jgi:hypothetical protein
VPRAALGLASLAAVPPAAAFAAFRAAVAVHRRIMKVSPSAAIIIPTPGARYPAQLKPSFTGAVSATSPYVSTNAARISSAS